MLRIGINNVIVKQFILNHSYSCLTFPTPEIQELFVDFKIFGDLDKQNLAVFKFYHRKNIFSVRNAAHIISKVKLNIKRDDKIDRKVIVVCGRNFNNLIITRLIPGCVLYSVYIFFNSIKFHNGILHHLTLSNHFHYGISINVFCYYSQDFNHNDLQSNLNWKILQ